MSDNDPAGALPAATTGAPEWADDGPGSDAMAEHAGTADAPLTGDEVEGVFEFLDAVDAEATAALRAEWGAAAAAHLGHAHRWFTTAFTGEERDSMVVTPGLVRLAARRGRALAAGARDPDHAGRADEETGAPDAVALRRRVGELRRRREDAQRAGDYRRARALDEEERAAWARLSGAAPVVGRAGRGL